MAEVNASSAQDLKGSIFRHLLKLSIGLGIVAFLIYKYDVQTIFTYLAQANLNNILIAWFFGLLALLLYSLMNRIALGPLNMPLKTMDILKILFQTRFYALVLPGATNMLVKWHKLARPGHQPAQAFALMAFSRTLHTFAILLLSLVGIYCDNLFPWPQLRGTMLVLLTIAGLLLLLFTSEVLIDSLAAIIRRLWGRLPVPQKVGERIEKLARISTAFKRLGMSRVGLVVGLAILGNLSDTIQHVYIARSVGVDLSIFTIAWLRGVMTICAIIPISVSGLGIREFGIVALLAHYGIPEAGAMAYSLLFATVFLLGKGLIGGIAELLD